MSVKKYSGCNEILFSDTDAAIFQNAIADLKTAILAYGYAPEAVEKLNFDLKAYTLTIAAEEVARGAWHRHATGQPFFELMISAPGSILTMNSNPARASNKQLPETQSLKLAFEFGINVCNNMEDYLRAAYRGEKFDDMCAGGASLPFDNMDITTTFNVSVEKYMAVFVKACTLRLADLDAKGIALETAFAEKKSATPPKPPAF